MILLLGWYARLASVKEIALQQAFAEMESLEAAWRTKTPARQADTPPEILHLLDTPFPSVFFDTELERPRFYEPSNVLLTGEVIAAMREGLRPCQSGLKVVRRLADMPHAKLAVPDDYVTVFVQGTLGANVNNLATILSADIQLRAHDQDPDGALASCRARINLARALRQGSGIAGFRDGTDIAASTLPLIEQSLGLGEPSEAALVALQQLLAEEYPQLALFQRLRISWRFMDSILNESKTNTRGFLTDLRRVPKIPVRVPSAERLSMLVENSIADDRLENLRRYRELMQAALLPSDERNAQFMAIDAAWQADPRTNRLLEDPRRLVLSQEKWEGELCSTIVALVVERYRLQNGSWPELLSVLVPKFLPAVPLDPIDGKPLRYRRLVDGVVIYSVGSDGIDNGGNIELAGPLMRAGTDAGFRLWDPAKRRQPARLMRTQLPGMAQPPPPTNSRQPRRNLMGGIVVPTKKK